MSFTQSLAYTQLKSVFRGQLVLPTDTGYRASLKRWSVLAERNAGVVAFVKDEEDVAAAVKFAVAEKVEIAIKGGGHNPSGASSTDGGIVIDLSKYLNKVTVDQEAKIAHVGGGALWSDVDKATCPLGLATVAGTVTATGVGGLALGGGYGFLTGRHGLTIDNLVGATVVVGKGQITQADEHENQDLFWAIRGGGSNFGIVTNFRFALHPIPPTCWLGVLYFSPDQREEVVEAAMEWRKNVMSADDSVLMATTHSEKDGAPVILVACVHIGPEDAAERQFKPFYDVGPTEETSGEKTYFEINSLEDNAAGQAYYTAGASVLNPTPQVFRRIMAIQADLKLQIPQADQLIGLEMYHTAKIQQMRNDEMAFACRGPQSNFIISVHWPKEEIDNVDVEEVRKKVKDIVAATKDDDLDDEPIYGNYGMSVASFVKRRAKLSDGDQITGDRKVRELFGDNYRKLQTIKAKYDPDLVFGKWFPIQPLA